MLSTVYEQNTEIYVYVLGLNVAFMTREQHLH
jgi:hypothetical protein